MRRVSRHLEFELIPLMAPLTVREIWWTERTFVVVAGRTARRASGREVLRCDRCRHLTSFRSAGQHRMAGGAVEVGSANVRSVGEVNTVCFGRV